MEEITTNIVLNAKLVQIGENAVSTAILLGIIVRLAAWSLVKDLSKQGIFTEKMQEKVVLLEAATALDVAALKEDVKAIKEGVDVLKADVITIKEDVGDIKQKMSEWGIRPLTGDIKDTDPSNPPSPSIGPSGVDEHRAINDAVNKLTDPEYVVNRQMLSRLFIVLIISIMLSMMVYWSTVGNMTINGSIINNSILSGILAMGIVFGLVSLSDPRNPR